MTRYWKIGNNTLGTSNDDVDLAVLEPAAEELTFAEYEQAQADLTALLGSASPPVTTSLAGNGQSYATNPSARKVTVQVIAPTGGPSRARPTVDGTPVAGGAGSFVYDQPGHALVIKTNAGNNDVVIVEEF